MRKEERVTELMYKACIFDLDGTIEDTVESIAHTANQVLEDFSLPPGRWKITGILRETGQIL